MNEVIDPQKLEFYVLPSKDVPVEHRERYNEVYRQWRQLWSQTLEKEHDVKDILFSNDFTRQDEILALFYNGQCVGLCCLRLVDFREEGALHDSYFEKWTELGLRRLQKHGTRTVICSQLTLAPEFRRHFLGIPWKDLLSALTVKRFQQLNCESMTATVRRSRGMDKATYQVGFLPLQKELTYLAGEKVDLVVCLKSTANATQLPIIASLVEDVFSRRIVLTHKLETETATEEVKHAA